MPHCDTCDRFYNPNTLEPDGTCPACGKQLGEPLTRFETEGSPWHFKLLVVTLAVGFTYMTASLIQLDLAAQACPAAGSGTAFAVLMST